MCTCVCVGGLSGRFKKIHRFWLEITSLGEKWQVMKGFSQMYIAIYIWICVYVLASFLLHLFLASYEYLFYNTVCDYLKLARPILELRMDSSTLLKRGEDIVAMMRNLQEAFGFFLLVSTSYSPRKIKSKENTGRPHSDDAFLAEPHLCGLFHLRPYQGEITALLRSIFKEKSEPADSCSWIGLDNSG